MTTEWHKTYKTVVNTRPATGSVLRTLDNKACKVFVELKEGKTPFLYCLLYVPCIVGRPVGWFVRSIEDTSNYGFKGILMPKARDLVMNHPRIPVGVDFVGVDEIKIVKEARQGNSLLIEISDLGGWIDREDAKRKESTNEDHTNNSDAETPEHQRQ